MIAHTNSAICPRSYQVIVGCAMKTDCYGLLNWPACSCVAITLPASLPAHVQKNIAFAGLMNSVHSVRYGCDFADVLCRFSSRVSCRGPDDLGQIFNLFSKLHAEKSEEYYCSGGNSRPSRPSGMGGGHFLVTPYDYSFHLVQLRFALKNSLKSPACSCVSVYHRRPNGAASRRSVKASIQA